MAQVATIKRAAGPLAVAAALGAGLVLGAFWAVWGRAAWASVASSGGLQLT